MGKFRDLLRTVGLVNSQGKPLRSSHGMPAIHLGRHRTTDVAFKYEMIPGISGDVNRTHPVTIEPCVMDPDNPILFYGQAGVIDGTSHKFRRVLTGDDALATVYGFAVRPYPIAAGSASGQFAAVGFGGGVPPINQPIDVMRAGYMMVQMFGTPTKGQAAYVWAAADAGGEVAGQATVTTTGGSTIGPLPNSSFQAGVGTNGVGEIIFNV